MFLFDSGMVLGFLFLYLLFLFLSSLPFRGYFSRWMFLFPLILPLPSTHTFFLYGHIMFTPFTIKFFLLVLGCFFIVENVQYRSPKLASNITWVEVAFLVMAPVFTVLNSIVSFVFAVEITSLLLLMMVLTYGVQWAQIASSYFVLFWLSFITSLLLFLGLVFFCLGDGDCMFTTLGGGEVTFLGGGLPAAFFFLFPLLLKLALPPLFLWKPSLFATLPLPLLSFYVLFYSTIFFIIVLYVFLTFLTSFIHLGIVLPFFLLALLTLSCQLRYTPSINLFLVYSSLLNAQFLLFLLIPILL